ncbi:PRC and DUF2382 domain-containing protein [Kribbella sp. HUAS MG21]|uniref:PRC and DUF2382 domain-containing protein n=1 Tax=Kribbella sp. HUAS MG21 TaxID=3160966 RepID=A0AAU7T4L9_9ACTN
MTMQGIEQIVGETAYDAAGEKVGSVGNVYTSDATGSPEWVTVNTGLFGTKQSFAPLDGAHVERDGLHLAPTKSKIKDAPRIDANGHLSDDEATELYRYYGVRLPQRTGRRQPGYGDRPTGRTDGRAGTTDGRTGPADGRTEMAGGPQDESMIRSEERLRTGTETVESGRVSLHKYVVTEEQQVSVPVRHEEARVVREPLAEGDARRTPTELGDEDREVVLHEERPVVAKETVPVERVGLETETVQGEEQVSETVRKEEVEVKGLPDDHADRRTSRDPKHHKKH